MTPGEHFHKFGNFEEARFHSNGGVVQAKLDIRCYYQHAHGVKISKTETIWDIRTRILAKENKPAGGMDAMEVIRE